MRQSFLPCFLKGICSGEIVRLARERVDVSSILNIESSMK
jgi:hypothetical protein